MSKVDQIQAELEKLSPAELEQVRDWLEDLTEAAGSNQICCCASATPAQRSTQSLAALFGRGDEVFITARNLIEFWAVAMRRQA